MTRGRWRPSDEWLAPEIYAILIQKKKPTRTYRRAELMKYLKRQTVYVDFIKLCLEYDFQQNQKDFKRGLFLVVQAVGVSVVAKKSGLSRLTLYRMLSPSGNPRFSSLMKIFRLLDLHLWIVDKEFISNRKRLVRPKDEPKQYKLGSGNRRLGRGWLPDFEPD